MRHAIDTGLSIMVVIPTRSTVPAPSERVQHLDLAAWVHRRAAQVAMEHVVYASAVNGFARLDPEDGNMDVPLLDMIVDDIPLTSTWTVRWRCSASPSTLN